MIERKVWAKLNDWHSVAARQALLLTGARQVGKTYIIREFAKAHYEHFAEINLLTDKNALKVLTEAGDADDILARISLLSSRKLVPGKTLIFIDEVQECKDLVTAAKPLVERGGYHFAFSGSLLGVELKDIRSVPVGYMDSITMYPLDFEEYCRARGVTDDAFDIARESFDKRAAMPDYVHSKLLRLYYEYLIVGGMPAAVDVFCESSNIRTARELQAGIIKLNRWDISRYSGKDELAIKRIYDTIPAELNKQNKRFILSDMSNRARFRELGNSFVWLTEAGVAIPVFCVDKPVHPLMLSCATNLFKLFMADVGLLTSLFLKDTALSVLARNPNVNYGSVFENAVAQELVAAGLTPYYYKSNKRGELDFVCESVSGRVIPIEVKSGKDYKRHNAMSNITDDAEYGIGESFILCESNIERHGKYTYMPVYLAGMLAR
jgi:predicted AAA+ superfamily ATPase